MNRQDPPRPIDVVAGILIDNGRILVGQRAAHVRHPGKWEFPGGKVEPGESLSEALRRELREELAIDTEIGREIWRTIVVVEQRPRLRLVFYAVPAYTGVIRNEVFAAIAWVEPSALAALDLLDADRDFIARFNRGELGAIA